MKTLDVFRSPRYSQQDVGLKEKSRSDGHISLGNVLLAVKQVSSLQDFSEAFFKRGRGSVALPLMTAEVGCFLRASQMTSVL